MSERSALIVGAGDAIGAAILKRFSRAGYNTVGVRRNPEKIASVISELQKEKQFPQLVPHEPIASHDP